MKTIVAFATLLLATTAHAAPILRRADPPIPDDATIARLAPKLGASKPLKETGFGDCEGPVLGSDGKPARVPCSCPPDPDEYIRQLTANVKAGHAINNPTVKVTFPAGDTVNDAHGRITAAAITLQNLEGPGKGCPLVATTLGVQSKQLDDGTLKPSDIAGGASPAAASPSPAPASSSPAATSPAPAATSSSAAAPAPPAATSAAPAAPATSPAAGGAPDDETIARLAPNLGAQKPLKPTGFGDCEGPVNGSDGKPARVPCSCPPDQDEYIRQLTANVKAGHAINNPTVKVSFPTGTSKEDQHGRITAAVITLQNLEGPGKGCPLVATTLGEQSKAIDAA